MNFITRIVTAAFKAFKFSTRWWIALAIAGAPAILEFVMFKNVTHLLVYPLVYAVVNGLLWLLAPDALSRLGSWASSPRWLPSLVRNIRQAWAFFAAAAWVYLLVFDESVFALIVLCVVLALFLCWLLLTASGRLALATTRIGIASLPQRWGASSVIVVGIAGVVAVLVAMLAMGEGFKATLDSTGDENTAIVLRGGSQAETNSVLTRDHVPLLTSLPGIAKGPTGKPLLSAELSQIVNLPSMADGTDANAQFRGVGEDAWLVRGDKIKLVEGRKFAPGLREIVVGTGAAGQFRGLKVGSTINLGNQEWAVVGRFASGDSHDSEIWGDAETLGSTYNRRAYQSITVRTEGKAGFDQFKAAVDADPRLKLDVETTKGYYAKQSGQLSRVLNFIGKIIGVIMAFGAVFGALNTMYAAVAGRAREIATMRAIGFRGLPVVTAVMLETMLLALIGGLLGGLLAWAVFNGYSVSTLGNNFSQVVFQFKVSPELLWNGLKWALAIGLIGGLFPALRAARLPITTALRAL